MANPANAETAQDEPGTDRRGFLKLAGLGSVATGAALVTGERAQAATPEPPKTTGYRETAHVRAAYATARF
ncbi:MAG: twin-arginine translocation signal domain-containing protein [Mangrovicoccus sp.]|nr:twin-arginine translocation signal domain-containing protein [Mangrovicoccus sp.]